MRIGLAAARFPVSVEDGVNKVKQFLKEAGKEKCDLICFPEAYLPGMRGVGFDVPRYDPHVQREALEEICQTASAEGVAVILGMEWDTEKGVHNAAIVISEEGEVLGCQAKNQIPIEEEIWYVPDGVRQVFTVKGTKFGIAICHEGWRYPETVRWAARHGAQIVFHPQMTGSDEAGIQIKEWGHPDSPFYEKAMICRSMENSIYFASVNYALNFQDSATSLIAPDGTCLAHVPYGEERLLVCDIDVSQATRFLADRYQPALYGEK